MIALRMAAVAALLLTAGPAIAAGPAPQITDVKAQLYYRGTGTFSDDLLKQKDLSLWNTIIGAGSSGGASTMTLVTVEVSGKDVPQGKINVEITATGEKGRALAKHVSEVTIYDDATKYYAPMLINDTGCEEIKIAAKLTGKGIKMSPIVKTIPFACGE